MIVTIHNRKYNDKIAFEIDELNKETRQDILDSVHSRGWKDDDCWSEVDN
jgi:hypothetical protein